jgi:hypothetical protein
VSCPLWQDAQVRRQIANYKRFWPDATPLSIQQTVQHLYESYPHLGETLIEDKGIAWLEMEYSPGNYCQSK